MKTKTQNDGRLASRDDAEPATRQFTPRLWRDAQKIMGLLYLRPEGMTFEGLSIYFNFSEERIAQALDSLLRTKFVIVEEDNE